MAGYRWWEWSDPEEQNKLHAQDVIENARKMREESDRSQIQQHVGGIIESFQRDVQQRMEPLTSRFNSYMAPAATPKAEESPVERAMQAARPTPAPPTPAPREDDDASPVDRVMKSFTGRTAQQLARDATSWMDPVMDPIMEFSGANDTLKRRDEMQGILDKQRAATPEPATFAERIKRGGSSSIGGILTAPQELDPDYAAANPDEAKRYGELYQDDTLGALGSVGGGIKVAGGAFAKAVGPVVRGAAQQKVASSYGFATPGVDLGLKTWKSKFFDDLAPVKGVMDGLEKAFGRALTDQENAYDILRLGRASAEIGDAWYRNHVGAVLDDVQRISGSVAQGRADLNDYLRAKDAIDKAASAPGRNFGGMKKADAEQALYEMQARLGANFADLERGADQFYKLGDFLLDRKVKAGLVSADDANFLKAKYPHYMPIQVIDWLDDNLAKTATRVGKVGGGANDIKKLTELGTDRAAEEPLQAFYRAAERTAMLAAKNEAANAIVEAAKRTPYLQGLIRPADNATAALSGLKTTGPNAYKRLPGESELRLKVGGKDAVFFADRSLEPLVSFGTTTGDDFFRNVFGPVANLTRKASIAYNPVWGAGQLVMDSLSFLVKEGGLSDPKGLARNLKYLGEGAKEAFTRGDVYKIAAEAGALPGTIDHVSGRAGSYDKIVGRMTGRDVTSPKEFVKWAASQTLGRIPEINERLDAVPRLAEFALKMDEGKSVRKAALAARDITIDPSRGGSFVKQVNAAVPFFNVAFQGAAWTPRLLRNPETRDKAMMGITSSVILPSMALEHLNRQDPRYKDVPDFDKDRGLIVMSPWGKGKIDPNTGVEKPSYFLIRTGPFTPFVTLGRAMYASATGQDVDMFKTGRALAKQVSPLDPTPVIDAARSGEGMGGAALKTAVPLLPAGIRQATEAFANYDTFRDRAIVPKGLENQPAERQFTSETSETAKYLGPLLGVAPAQLDFFLKAWGGAADAVVDVFDAAGEGATDAVKATTGLDTGFGSSGESQRLIKLRRDAAKSGLSEEERATIEGEIERELAIKADRDSSVRNTPVVGQLAGRYYREIGAQSVEDRVDAVEKALLAKKRDKGPVGKELERIGIGFSDVKGQIGGVTLTREAAATYREKALAYRDRLLSDLVGQDFYKQADDEGKERLLREVMQRGAGWAAAEAVRDNPLLLDKVGVGSEFVSDQIGANIDVAARKYIGALGAQAELDADQAKSRFLNVRPEEYRQVVRDRGELSQYKQAFGDREGEMVFMSRHGAERLAKAKNARESRFWDSHVEAFKRQNPDYVLFDATKSKVVTRRGLDAQAVARLAGM
jgi:hypothetical protein